MAKRKRQNYSFKRLQAHSFNERDYKPYALAIGQIALAWNDLHEKLGEIFVCILDGIDNIETDDERLEQLAAVWSSANNDRAKRNILEALLATASTKDTTARPRMVEDVRWLLKEANKLEDVRNDVVHSPLLWLGYTQILAKFVRGEGLTIVPNVTLGNTRAVKLAKKDLRRHLIVDFRWARNAILVLRNYAHDLRLALLIDGRAWPGRPRLPNRGQRKMAQPQHRRPHPK